MKIINLVGARPQFVKAAMLSRALRRQGGVEEVIVHTGQHYDAAMSEDILKELDFPTVHHNLGINRLSHGAMTGRMIEALEQVFQQENPEALIIYGDTNSTLAGAVAAVKLGIRIAHVEAGMRCNNLHVPEEANRVVADRLSEWLFTASEQAYQNLLREGYGHLPVELVNSGDVMLDAFLHFLPVARERIREQKVLPGGDFVLCTVHREATTDHPDRLREVFAAIDRVQERIPVVMPLHPRTRARMEAFGIKTKALLIEPASYLGMLWLLDRCALVMTDSGGLQKEAFFSRKPCVTLRPETEWIELVEHGYNKVVGTDPQWVVNHVFWMLEHPPEFLHSFYGEGHAADTIAAQLVRPSIHSTRKDQPASVS
jgi:UDP-GlcNAc3NAcA epimerase